MTLPQQSPSPSAPHAPATEAAGRLSPETQQPAASTPFNAGSWLRDLRTRIGWSQQELADRIKSNRAVISRLENGKRSLTSGFRARIMVAVRHAERGL